MSVAINYIKKKISSPKSNLILFCNDKFNTNSLKKYLSNSEISYINDLLKSSVNEPEVQAWQSKTEEALDKLRIVSLNDSSLTPMISDFEKKLNRKLKSRKAKITMKKSGLTLKYVGIGIIMIPGLIFCYYFYKWLGELFGLF